MNLRRNPALGGPVERLGLPHEVTLDLRGRGIVTCAQVYDFTTHAPSAVVEACLHMGKREAVALYGNRAQMGAPDVGGLSLSEFGTGLAGPSGQHEKIALEREITEEGRRRLLERARTLEARGKLPTRVDLTRHDPAGVLDQGSRGTCVGFASSSERQLPVQTHLAPLFAYALAKQLDGRPDLEGTWLRYAFRGFAEVGHLRERSYPYREDFVLPLAVEKHRRAAAGFRVRGYTDVLLAPGELADQPSVFGSTRSCVGRGRARHSGRGSRCGSSRDWRSRGRWT